MLTTAQAQTPHPDANTILARVKAGLRTRVRPPYVVYTLVRRETLDGVPDFVNSYTLRIWCRTSDNAALARHAFGLRVTGPAQFITPAFDKPIDPGPPTADLLDVVRGTSRAPEVPPDAALPSAEPVQSLLPRIGSVAVFIETTYRLSYAGADANDDHLRLEARRDSDQNRLSDLYVDRTTNALHRAVAHDHLFVEARKIPERFEIDFATRNDVAVIVKIHGETDYGALDASNRGEAFHQVDYRFEDIEFPAQLPAWYFDPAQYGAHHAELPN